MGFANSQSASFTDQLDDLAGVFRTLREICDDQKSYRATPLAGPSPQEKQVWGSPERISDHQFQVRAVACADLDLGEEPFAVFGAQDDIEPTLNLGVVPPPTIIVVPEAQNVQGGTRPDVVWSTDCLRAESCRRIPG